MFWQKSETKEQAKLAKLSAPQAIPGPVQKYLVAEKKMDTELVALLKAVIRKDEKVATAHNIRIFDEAEAKAKKVVVKDYITLDQHPDLTIYDGSYDESLKKVELTEKKKISADTRIFTKDEILKQIEALKEPGSTVFFYMAAGSTSGGPLAMGAAVVEANPDYPGKKQKKYNIYCADVIDMKPVGKGLKLFDSDKPKDIAAWVQQGHHKRTY